MTTYNSTFFDLLGPTPRREEDTLRGGNNWHQKMGYQKPSNLDQSISHIRSTEYAPFTREPEQPSIATLYLQQTYGNIGQVQQEQQDYGMEDVPSNEPTGQSLFRRQSNSPDRGGVRRPGPEWGNTHFGTKPRRRSAVESEIRTVVDDNAPPLITFYDDLVDEEQIRQQQQQHLENSVILNGGPANTLTNGANGALVPTGRAVFNNPTAVRVSNYQDHRWHDVLRELIPFGTILERFDQLRTNPNHEFIPTKVLAESDDEVVRQARLLFTGDGWTKVTYATRESAMNAIAQSGKINIGGRDLNIELWKPEFHGRSDPLPEWRAPAPTTTATAVPAPSAPFGFGGVDAGGSTSYSAANGVEGFRQRNGGGGERSIFDPLATPTQARPNGGAYPDNSRLLPMPNATPGGSRLSTVIRGAKVVNLREMSGGVFQKQPSMWARVMSWFWGDVGPSGRGDEAKEGGWKEWMLEKLFGRL